MRKIESIEDDMRGVITYEISPGRWATFDVRAVREYGLEEIMKAHGITLPEGRFPVFQDGTQIGTVPATFEPVCIKSSSFFYDPRPGDFKRTSTGWEASRNLGPGDLHAVPGFEWGSAAKHEAMEASRFRMNAALLSAVTGRKS